jgi:hypothetical protein
MSRILNPNFHIMLEAASRLGELCDEMVFIGGCATGILITDQAAPEVRPTVDVDVIVEAVSRGEYYRIEKALQSKGFNQIMQDDSPICKWYADGVELDVMPTDPAGQGRLGVILERIQHIIDLNTKKSE